MAKRRRSMLGTARSVVASKATAKVAATEPEYRFRFIIAVTVIATTVVATVLAVMAGLPWVPVVFVGVVALMFAPSKSNPYNPEPVRDVDPRLVRHPGRFVRLWAEDLATAWYKVVLPGRTGIADAPADRAWAAAELGAGTPYDPFTPDHGLETRFWPPGRLSTWVSIALGVAAGSLMAPFGTANSLAAALCVFYAGQTYVMSWRRRVIGRRPTYLERRRVEDDDEELLPGDEDLIEFDADFESATAHTARVWESLALARGAIARRFVAVAGGGVLLAVVWGTVFSGSAYSLNIVVAGAFVAVGAAVGVAARAIEPEYNAGRMDDIVTSMEWQDRWTGLLGPRAIGATPGRIGGYLVPEHDSTHHYEMFSVAAGKTLEYYLQFVESLRADVSLGPGRQSLYIEALPRIENDAFVPGTQDSSSFAVVYALDADDTGLLSASNPMSRELYAKSAAFRAFAAARLPQPRLERIRQLGRSSGIPLVETEWEFPAGSGVTLAALLGARDKLRSALAVPFIAVGTRNEGKTLSVVFGAQPEQCTIARSKDQEFVTGLLWDEVFRSAGVVTKSGEVPALVSDIEPVSGLRRAVFRLPVGMDVKSVAAKMDALRSTRAVEYANVYRSADDPANVVLDYGADPSTLVTDDPDERLAITRMQWDNWFRACGLTSPSGAVPTCVEVSDGDRGLVVAKFTMPPGLDTATVEAESRRLAEAARVGYLDVSTPAAGDLTIIVGASDPLDDAYPFSEHQDVALKAPGVLPNLRWVAGIGVDGNPVYDDFEEELPHLFVGGATKMGKSTLINSMVLQLTHSNTPEQLQFWMAEPKNELQTWLPLPHVTRFVDRRTPADSVYEALGNMLADAVNEMERRYTILDSLRIPGDRFASPKNLGAALAHGLLDEPMPYLIILVEECGDYFKPPALKEHKPAYEAMLSNLEKLTRKARAAGIFVIALTQYPIKENIPSTAKQQMRRIGLGTADQMASLVILGQPGLERIKTRGRGILLDGQERRQFRSLFIEEGVLTSLLSTVPGVIDEPRHFDERGREVKAIVGEHASEGLPELPDGVW